VASVVITSPSGAVNVGALGRTVQFQAQARDANGNALAGRTITWSSSDQAVATVSASGLVTATGNGATNIVATSEGVASSPVTVTVLQVVAAVQVTPPTFTLGAVGRTQQLAAAAADSTGNAVSGASFSWSSTNTAVATVDNAGLVTAVANGSAQIRATASGITGSADVTVAVRIASIVISPTSRTFTRITQTQTFTATARDSNNNVIASPLLTWISRNAGVATVNSSGLATSIADGATYVVVLGGLQDSVVRDSAQVTVSAVANSVVITPSSVDFGAIGSSRQLSATVRDSGNTTIPGRTVTWSKVGTGNIATVSAAGLVTSTAVGQGDSAVASATGPAGPITARAPITVTQVVNTITVTTGSPVPDTLKTTGRTRQFSAAAADSNNNAIAGVSFTWASTVPAVASVDASGLATAVSDGTTSIQASAQGRTGTRTLVVRRFAATFTLTPPGATITVASGTAQFTGTAEDSVSTPLLVTWLSRSTAVATVSPASGTSPSTATATAVANGTTQIVMSSGGRTDSASVTVNIPVSFANDVQPIFTNNCAISGCHTGPSPTGPGLNLSAGQAYNALVNKPSVGFPGATLVIPNDPDNSYLVRKLENRNIAGARMPDGAAALPQSTINVIRNWIAAGAQNN
jgi:uncharacterized protein YjdB